MARALTPAELGELLGAYALDAVDADERAQIEEWLARTPNARRDADELRETASLLAQSAGEVPVDVWTRIQEELGDAPPPLRLAPVAALDDRRARPRTTARSRAWLVGVAAALVLVLAVSAGVIVARQNSSQDARIDRMAAGLERDGMRRAAMSAAMEPGSRAAALVNGDGEVKAKVITTADGTGYFLAGDMPTLSEGRTYQLWALMGDAPGSAVVSVGVLGRHPEVKGFNADAGVRGFVVTDESAPGVVTTSQPPMVSGWLA